MENRETLTDTEFDEKKKDKSVMEKIMELLKKDYGNQSIERKRKMSFDNSGEGKTYIGETGSKKLFLRNVSCILLGSRFVNSDFQIVECKIKPRTFLEAPFRVISLAFRGQGCHTFRLLNIKRGENFILEKVIIFLDSNNKYGKAEGYIQKWTGYQVDGIESPRISQSCLNDVKCKILEPLLSGIFLNSKEEKKYFWVKPMCPKMSQIVPLIILESAKLIVDNMKKHNEKPLLITSLRAVYDESLRSGLGGIALFTTNETRFLGS
eukprot:snap_masked-scaffold_2-processed-gene-7.42-mRNA-1 protein AED:1.00 eAED:1.00 QI:0/-1/0/0/-1/1/1/0/264